MKQLTKTKNKNQQSKRKLMILNHLRKVSLTRIQIARFQKQKAKFDEQLAKAVEDGKSEGQKLAKMSAQEKADAEEQERLAKLDEREQELNKRELTANVGDILTEKGLPKELANSLVVLGDADKISAVVDMVQKSIEQGVNDGVKERMRQDPPTNGGSNLNATDDPFAKVLNQYK